MVSLQANGAWSSDVMPQAYAAAICAEEPILDCRSRLSTVAGC